MKSRTISGYLNALGDYTHEETLAAMDKCGVALVKYSPGTGLHGGDEYTYKGTQAAVNKFDKLCDGDEDGVAYLSGVTYLSTDEDAVRQNDEQYKFMKHLANVGNKDIRQCLLMLWDRSGK